MPAARPHTLRYKTGMTMHRLRMIVSASAALGLVISLGACGKGPRNGNFVYAGPEVQICTDRRTAETFVLRRKNVLDAGGNASTGEWVTFHDEGRIRTIRTADKPFVTCHEPAPGEPTP